MYKKILIATDGSETAGRAARIGAELSKSSNGEVILLYVGEPQAGTPVLEAVKAELGVNAKLIAEPGDPADKILSVAEDEGVDLIVVGNKGMTGARRFLLGSVPNQVSHNARTNVLIVKTT